MCLCPQQGLRTLQDLAPEMRLAMASDLEEEEGDEMFDSERGTSVNTTPASTPLPHIDMLVEQTTVFMEPEPRAANGGVVSEQVTGLLEHHRPGSELAGLSVVTEQPVRSEPLPIIRWDFLTSISTLYLNQHSEDIDREFSPVQGGLHQRVTSSSSSSPGDGSSPGVCSTPRDGSSPGYGRSWRGCSRRSRSS